MRRNDLIAGLCCALFVAAIVVADRARITLTEPDGTTRTFTADADTPDNPPPPAAVVRPFAPDRFSLSDATDKTITLHWADNSDDEAGFSLQWSGDGGATWSDLAGVGANALETRIVELTPNTEYAFHVRAFNSAGASAWSNVAIGKTGPPVVVPDTSDVEGGKGTPTPTPANAVVVQSGADLSALSGVVALRAGEYKCNGKLRDNVRIFSADGVHKAIVTQPGGKQITGGVGVQVYGVVFRGGGIGTHNDKAAIITNDGWYLEDVLVEKSTGSGINIAGSNVKSTRLIAQDNAASGRGFKCKGYVEVDSIIRRNNAALRDGDGANKATRSTGILIINSWCYHNVGRGLWFDYRNAGVVRGGRCFENRTKSSSDYSYGGAIFYEYNAGDGDPRTVPGLVVDGVTFYGNDGISVSIGESQNIEIKNCVFRAGNPKSPYAKWAIGFRNIKRGSETNLVRNVSIHDNTFADDTGIYSNGGVTLSGNKISVGANNWGGGDARIRF